MRGIPVQSAIDNRGFHVKQLLGSGSAPSHLVLLAHAPVVALYLNRKLWPFTALNSGSDAALVQCYGPLNAGSGSKRAQSNSIPALPIPLPEGPFRHIGEITDHGKEEIPRCIPPLCLRHVRASAPRHPRAVAFAPLYLRRGSPRPRPSFVRL
jgi:hypothetical protein